MTGLSAPILVIFYICNPRNTTVTLNLVKVPEKTQKMSRYYDHDLGVITDNQDRANMNCPEI